MRPPRAHGSPLTYVRAARAPHSSGPGGRAARLTDRRQPDTAAHRQLYAVRGRVAPTNDIAPATGIKYTS